MFLQSEQIHDFEKVSILRLGGISTRLREPPGAAPPDPDAASAQLCVLSLKGEHLPGMQ